MSVELFIAKTFVVLPAALIVFIDLTTAYIVVHTVREWRRDAKARTVPGGMWQALNMTTTLNIIIFAALDVGQAMVLWQESGELIIWLNVAFFAPWLAARTVEKVKAPAGISEPADQS